MDQLSRMTTEDLSSWLMDKEIPMEVIESFEENAMDGEALVTLIGIIPGPDCLKDLIKKVGLRLKVYKAIKVLYDTENINQAVPESPGYLSSPSPSIASEKVNVGSRHVSPVVSICTSDKCSPSGTINKEHPTNSTRPKIEKKDVPELFPIPTFRNTTEANLAKEILTDCDRKYIVQTLATMLMTHVSRPSLRDCQIVSKALHLKFHFLGDETSQNAWKWFIYTRSQNVNRNPDKGASIDVPHTKRVKIDDHSKHSYPPITESADDDASNKRNLELLREEFAKTKPRNDVLKELMARTYPFRRQTILNSPMSVTGIILEMPLLKKCTYMTQEFALVMQRPNIREEFDDDLLIWSKAIITYCRNTQKRSSAIQLVLGDSDFVDLDCDSLLMKTMRCLSLLLLPTKTKHVEGDIPFVMRFLPTGTPPSDAPDKENNQPHIVVIEHEDYSQYFIAVEQVIMLESTNLASALFLLLATHYVFNLSYHTKAAELLMFIQEKFAKIPTVVFDLKHKGRKTKDKSPVASSHVVGIVRCYESLKDEFILSDHDMD